MTEIQTESPQFLHRAMSGQINELIISSSDMVEASHEQLQEIVISLQTEIQNALQVSMKLKEANHQLCKDLEETRNSKSRMAERFHGLRNILTKQFEEFSKRQFELDEHESKFKAQLFAKDEQLRNLREELENSIRNDTVVRSKMRIEIEVEFDSRFSVLEQEISEWQKKYFEARRQHELCRSEFEQYRQTYLRETEDLKNTKEEHMNIMKDILDKLATSHVNHINSPNKTEITRLKSHIGELKSKMNEMTTYINNIEQSKANINESCTKQASKHHKEISDMTLILSATRTELSAMKKSYERIAASNDLLQQSLDDHEVALDKVRCENVTLKLALDESNNKLNAASRQYSDMLNLKEKEIEMKVTEAKEAIDTLQAQKKDLVISLKNLQSDLLRKLKSSAEAEELNKSRMRDENCQLQIKVREKEMKLEEVRDAWSRQKLNHKSELLQLKYKLETFRGGMEYFSREKSVIISDLVAAQKKCSDLDLKNEILQKNLQLYENEIQSCNEEKKALEEEKNNVLCVKTEMEICLKELENKLRITNDAHQKDLGDLRIVNEKSIKKLKESYKIELDLLNQELMKEKKRSKAYKDKAIHAHERSALVHQALTKTVLNENE